VLSKVIHEASNTVDIIRCASNFGQGKGKYANNAPLYYKNRVKEIFNPKHTKQDVWISRGELEGILNELTENQIYKKKLSIEHGFNVPTIHQTGISRVPKNTQHMNIVFKDSQGNSIKRHIFITNNPYDIRLKNVAIDVRGNVYHPEFPRGNYEPINEIIITTNK